MTSLNDSAKLAFDAFDTVASLIYRIFTFIAVYFVLYVIGMPAILLAMITIWFFYDYGKRIYKNLKFAKEKKRGRI